MSDSEDDYGPALPPSFDEEPERAEIIGPTLPPGFKNSSDADDRTVEPNASSDESVESDDDFIGPALPSSGIDVKRGYHKVARKSQVDDNPNGREEWMTVIPKKVEKKLLFTSVTSFSRKAAEPLPVEIDETQLKKDAEIAEALKSFTESKRSASLMNMHEDTLKKKSKGDNKPVGRMPLDFDPEKALHVCNFDEKKKRAIVEKSKLINSKFSQGSSKYL
ncbi:Uncharacterized protein HDE_11350 [Halotydeus destructor]|nr:Uncharacterized protein HDE_11350 [Halotydeus destructor]